MAQPVGLNAVIARHLVENNLANDLRSGSHAWLSIPGHDERIVPVRTAKNRLWRRAQGKSEFYEETATLVFSLLVGLLRPSTVFDVGAWEGHFSFLAASHSTVRPTVFAFEMRPPGIEAMKRRVAELGRADRVRPLVCGLSDTHRGATRAWSARTKLFEYEPRNHEYREAVWRRLKFYLRGDTSRALKEVELLVTTLDQFCADHAVTPTLLKIDVDGYEGKVLRGASNLLKTAKPTILLELHKDELQRDGISRTEVANILFDAGYAAFFLTDHEVRARCEVVPVAPGHPLLARQQTDMVVFSPPDACS